jgi:catechol 2,3-dioxygenase-like lactoylglutathione lyase family enzyme
MELGNFSVSLAVNDLAISRAFYERLGFSAIAGDATQNWLILANGDAKIGIFQGMFEGNILTFNPGWSSTGEPLPAFTDIRDIQRELKAQGVAITTEADESETGPAALILADPDGNVIMLDQHVPRP